MNLPINQIICGDCLEIMPTLMGGSIDMVMADPPYGTTACKWDSVIPLEPMWEQLKRLIKPNGAVVMTASQPFTTTLIASNMKMFKYCWYWKKEKGVGFTFAKFRPLGQIEECVVFGDGRTTYNPDMTKLDKPYRHILPCKNTDTMNSGIRTCHTKERIYKEYTHKYPTNIIEFCRDGIKRGQLAYHPTQKPVALMEYLIKTYTNKGETVLDFACGSGTTCKAAQNLNRRFIGIDISEEYCQIARQRIKAVETGVPVKEQNKGQMALFAEQTDKLS